MSQDSIHTIHPIRPRAVDVVVPVYGAATELQRCLDSVRRHTDLATHRLLLVADGPQPADVEEILSSAAAAHPGIVVLRQSERRGFAAAANRGIAAAESRDVVLLNSDTEVTAGWLDKLQAAAYSSADVASATPFSNAATICSLPRWLDDNALPAGHTVDSFAALIAGRSQRSYPRIPTGVGFCMYLNRRALDLVGPLDESYGPGYGEEVDWCLRATEHGLRHVLDDATFVYHAGQASFGGKRAGRVRDATRRLRHRHPRYWHDLADFLRRDPLREARERVLAGLAPARPAPGGDRAVRVLHVVHGWPPWNHAGTELYAAWLVRRQAAWREVAVLARLADPRRELGYALELVDHGARVRLLVNNFTQRDPRSRNALHDRRIERDFERLLAEFRPALLHVHHLAGHAATLPLLARRRGIPIVYQVQDWWTLCARANLMDDRRQPCSGPGLGKCARCLPLTGISPAGLLNRALHALRRRSLRRALAAADAWVMGSHAIAQSFRDRGLLGRDERVHVLDYGIESVPARAARPPRDPASPLRLGFVGSILPHKGLHVAASALRGLPSAAARLEVWGSATAAPGYLEECRALAGERLVHHGGFAEGTEDAVFAAMDVLLMPSVGLESYGLAAREALARGVPVLASRPGALAELLAGRECGALFALGDAAELRAWIERLLAEPQLLERWRRNVPPVKTMDEHAAEIEAVYREVLDRRSRP